MREAAADAPLRVGHARCSTRAPGNSATPVRGRAGRGKMLRLLGRVVLFGLGADSAASGMADEIQRAAETVGAGPGEAAVYRNGNLTGEGAWILRDGDGWRRMKKSPFKLYDLDGTQLRSLAAAKRAKMAFAADLERENWILPSLGAGLSRPILLPTPPGWRPANAAADADRGCTAQDADESSETSVFELKTLSERPRVFRVDGFLSKEEADHLRRVASPSMQQSSIAADGSLDVKNTDMRNSDTAWLPPRFGNWNLAEWSDGVDPVLQGIVSRGSKLLKMDSKLCDGFQVLRCECAVRNSCILPSLSAQTVDVFILCYACA